MQRHQRRHQSRRAHVRESLGRRGQRREPALCLSVHWRWRWRGARVGLPGRRPSGTVPVAGEAPRLPLSVEAGQRPSIARTLAPVHLQRRSEQVQAPLRARVPTVRGRAVAGCSARGRSSALRPDCRCPCQRRERHCRAVRPRPRLQELVHQSQQGLPPAVELGDQLLQAAADACILRLRAPILAAGSRGGLVPKPGRYHRGGRPCRDPAHGRRLAVGRTPTSRLRRDRHPHGLLRARAPGFRSRPLGRTQAVLLVSHGRPGRRRRGRARRCTGRGPLPRGLPRRSRGLRGRPRWRAPGWAASGRCRCGWDSVLRPRRPCLRGSRVLHSRVWRCRLRSGLRGRGLGERRGALLAFAAYHKGRAEPCVYTRRSRQARVNYDR